VSRWLYYIYYIKMKKIEDCFSTHHPERRQAGLTMPELAEAEEAGLQVQLEWVVKNRTKNICCWLILAV
jgi:hypothetical protein